MKLYLACFLIIFSKFAVCQTPKLTVKQIDSIVTAINSVKNYDSMVEDGTVVNTRKGIIKKIFVKKKTGGYSTTYFSDPVKKKLVKIIHEQSFGNFTRREYFYEDDSLVFVAAEKRESTYNFTVLSSGQFYFQQGMLIKRTGTDSLSKPAFLVRTGRRMRNDWYDFKKLNR